MDKKTIIVLATLCLATSAIAAPNPNLGLLRNAGQKPNNTPATAQIPVNTQPQKDAAKKTDPNAKAEGGDGKSHSFNWDGAPISLVLDAYSERAKKTILIDPQTDVKKTLTLKSEPGREFTEEEYLSTIEVVLEMNGVHLEPYGDKFVRALPRKGVRNEGIPILIDNKGGKLPESGTVVSMMIKFENISAKDEAKEALDQFKSATGVLIVFERTNSILVTDTQQNINRMVEIKEAIDKPMDIRENVFIRQIKYAAATDVKEFLEKIVEDSQKLMEKSGKGQANVANQARPTPQGSTRILPRNQQPAAPEANISKVMSISDAARGFIRGNVLILADERSNKLVIKSQKENMDFFDLVIQEIDIETTPDTVVKVYRLKYAEAEEVSDMINDLIGNAQGGKSSSKGSQNQNSKKGGAGTNITTGNAQVQRQSVNQRSGESKTGELSKDNTTVLADERINGLVVMTEKELVPTIERIIEAMDVKLSQVLIETVIIEVGLGDTIKTGVDWARGIRKNGVAQGVGGGGGNDRLGNATNAVAGQLFIDAAADAVQKLFVPGASGFNYAIASEKLDLQAIISLSKSDTHAKYLASPVIMTVDNKEATIEATEMRYLFKGYTYSGSSMYGTAVPDYEQKEIGITIKATPKINPNGTVMLEVEEEYSQEGSGQEIEGQNSKKFTAATTVTRKMSSDVVLQNGQTVVLGGLVDTYVKKTDVGIPILKDIPWIGRYLFGKTEDVEDRSELIIFMTPYVLNDAEAAQAEALRRKNALADRHAWEDHGWSASALADPVSQKEHLRRLKQEWQKQDDERKSKLAIEDAKLERVKQLEKMSKKEREKWLDMHKEELEREEKEEELERIKELENKLLDKESQAALRDLAAEVRARQLKEAESEIKKADDQSAKDNVNVHDQLQGAKAPSGAVD